MERGRNEGVLNEILNHVLRLKGVFIAPEGSRVLPYTAPLRVPLREGVGR